MAELTPLAEARPIAEAALASLAPYIDRGEVAGSIRRRSPQVKDIELVVIPSEVQDGLFGEVRLAVPEVRQICEHMGRVRKGGEKYIQVEGVLGSSMTLDLFIVTPPSDWGVQYALRTGPADFSRALVTRIRDRLWRCQDGWVRDDRGERVPCPTEEDFFRAAQLEYLLPPARTVARLQGGR